MATRKIIPDVYTEYEDGHLGVVPPGLANVEIKIGAALGGRLNTFYALSGPDAKSTAKALFKGGPLLRAVEEAFDAGSETIYACRIGPSLCASREFKVDTEGKKGVVRAKAPGEYGNHVSVATSSQPAGDAMRKLLVWTYEHSRHAIVGRDILTGAEGATVDVATEFSSVLDMKGTMAFGAGPVGDAPMFQDLWVLGRDPDDTKWVLHHYLSDGATPEGFETVDLTTVLAGEAPRALGVAGYNPGPPGQYMVVVMTDLRLGVVDGSDPDPAAWTMTSLFTAFDPGLTGLTVAGVTVAPLAEGLAFVLIDGAGKKAYRLAGLFGSGEPALTGTLDLSPLEGSADYLGAASMGFGSDDPDFSIAFLIGTDRKVVGFLPSLFDTATAVRPIDLVWVWDHLPAGAAGLNTMTLRPGESFSMEYAVVVTDHNLGHPVPVEYDGATEAEAFALATAQSSLVDVALEDGTSDLHPNDIYLEGGTDGLAPTNADYLHGLELSEAKTDASWVHCVGATTIALWTSILVHCARMAEEMRAERFAILECPAFESTADVGSVEYLTALQDHVDAIVARMESVADRNAAVFAGGGVFMDSDGNEYVAPSLASACAGVMASLEVHKSLINKQVPNLLRLAPEFSPGHVQQLIQARVNTVRLKPGRGYRIVHSLTGAPVGSDYSRINDLRAVYYGARQARLAAEPLVGEENDTEGLGLRRLESAMKRPLEVMLDHGQIDDFELKAVSSENDRLLGDVYVDMGVQPMRAMEMIHHKVFLK